MILPAPVPFQEAADLAAAKTVLPTSLNSAALRGLDRSMYRRAVVSARVLNAQYLDTIFGLSNDAVAGELDDATARLILGKMSQLLNVGHDEARLNLILDTTKQTVQGYAQGLQANDPDVVIAFPAAELFRLEDRDEPRNWEQRWREAAQASGDVDAAGVLERSGRMVALVNSPIWATLGQLWDDSIDNGGEPPFAFRSGMWKRSVDVEDAISLGLPVAQAKPREMPDFNENLKLSMDVRDANLRDAILNATDEDGVKASTYLEFREGALTFK